MQKLTALFHSSTPQHDGANEATTSSPSRQGAASGESASPALVALAALAEGSPRRQSANVGSRPRTGHVSAHSYPPPHPSMFSRMRGWMAEGASSKAPEPRAWIDANLPHARAARISLLDTATAVTRSSEFTLPAQQGGHQFYIYLAADASGTNTMVLAPGQELIPGLLRSDQMIELSSSHLDQLNALATRHPIVKTHMPDTKPRLRVITPAVAANLAAAREAIDLVKALLPYGAGNQIKDIAATGGESVLCSSLSLTTGGIPAARAFVAIQSQGGYCEAQAALAYQLLSQNPALRDCRIDVVGGEDHEFVVIRGQTSEQDIVVDAWAPFASPTLVQDALPMHQALLSGAKLEYTKPAGTVLPALNIEGALSQQAIQRSKYPSIRENYFAEKYRNPDSVIAVQLETSEDQWDIPFSGNPNIRYEVRDESGRRLIYGPLRFDMQRIPFSPGPYQTQGA
ncbi:Hrp-dependent type III effector protein [Xanthomonas campestris pv. asclepiadis]|uniref:Hrp-dependent type III effector protein n=1 Tax=Xanthomonas campestris TaxID=339 RepID=UPI001E585381|nr:Hrp-dependent type III effector protein [Xanthomonas campestris]MCC4615389.1 Hrp-dependent type III effector protein [Xanthomonas campestris pv. asclepiadis]